MEKQKLIKLKKFGYLAEINLSRGANCVKLRNETYRAKILREPDYTKELDNPYLYGMPILFPVNRISGGEFKFEGRTYRFPVNEPMTGCHLHGELHQTEFSVVEVSDSKLCCSYLADEQNPYLEFPHAFEIQMTYEIKEDGFYHTVKVINHSEYNMPVLLGFHTTFLSRFAEGSKEEDIRVLAELSEEYERNMKNYLPTGVKPKFDDISTALAEGEFSPFTMPTSRHYRSGKQGKMVIYDGTNDLSVVYENDDKYQFRLIYNGNADEYICLEPQNCMANCPNGPFNREEAGFDYIEPGKSKVYDSKIAIEEGDKR